MNKPSPTTEALVARPCTHDLADMETACADGMCPLCLADALRQKEAELSNALRTGTVISEALVAAERELAELRAQQPVAWIDPADFRALVGGIEAIDVRLCGKPQDGDEPLYAAIPPRSAE